MRVRRSRPIATLVAATLLIGASFVPVRADGGYIAEMETGRTAFRASDFDTAEKAFNGALIAAETDKRRAMAFFALGLTALRLDKFADARNFARQSLALVPDNPRAQELLATADTALAAGQTGSVAPAPN